jgi:hypothetical protein
LKIKKKMIKVNFNQNYLTAPFRKLPDFIIIGAQKSGTTALYTYLSGHPCLKLSSIKEVHYFDLNYSKGLNWYKSHFPDKLFNNKFLTGEATPYYFFHPLAPGRIKKHLPAVKFILLLRDPVDRAYSHYLMQKRKDMEPCSTFEEAIEAEPDRTNAESLRVSDDPSYYSFNHQHLTYLERGKYYSQLSHWLNYFRLEQFLIINSEDFYFKPIDELEKVYSFLEVDTIFPKAIVPQVPENFTPMNPETRAYLRDFYKEDTFKLFGLLGREFNWQ